MSTTAKKRKCSSPKKRWSAQAALTSNALDLESNVFKSTSARRIAASLKHSAMTSKRRKGTPFQSAMSMLNYYINRAGSQLSPHRKGILKRAKRELRREFGREE